MAADLPVQLSFRDPTGHVVRIGDRVFRALRREREAECQALLDAAWFGRLIDERLVPGTRRVDRPAGCDAWGDDWIWLDHEAIAFPLYPHETTAAQLHEAALLTLRIAQAALDNGWCLKDASAWNVLWDRGRPMFCDVASFAPDDGSALWMAYGQFGRHFVIPLLLHRHLGLPTASFFLTHRDGVPPREARRMLGMPRLLRHRAAIEFVLLPSMAESAGARPARSPRPTLAGEPAREVRRAMLGRLRGYLDGLDPASRKTVSTWSGYVDARDHYSARDLDRKSAFVAEALPSTPAEVLDLGCNSGEYSLMAARLGHRVVAADFDEHALMRLHRERQALPVSAANFNLAYPTPAIGWNNDEVASFLQRARGRFDTVLCLGLLHHLLVSERVPLSNILRLVRALEPRCAVIEWVRPDDPKFVEIAGANLPLYQSLDERDFEAALEPHWVIAGKQPLELARRTLYRLLPA